MTEWRDRAYCRRDPELWHTPKLFGVAVHFCRTHCPVVAECRIDRRADPCFTGVLRGIAYGSGGEPNSRQPRPVRCDACGGPEPESQPERIPAPDDRAIERLVALDAGRAA